VKRLLALVAVGALSAGASGCDLSPPAATINGSSISRAQLQDRLTGVTDHAVAQCALSIQAAGGGGTLPAVQGSGQDTVSTPFAAFILNGLVQQKLEESALARRHAAVTPADVAAARLDYETQLEVTASQVGSPCNLTGPTLVGHVPKRFLDDQARALATQEKLEEVVGHVDASPGAVRAYYDAHQAEVTQVCVNLIIATGQAAAQSIHDQIAAGTTFAAAAAGGTGVDPNTPPGAQEPCVYPANLVRQLGATAGAAVEALADGQLAAPQGIPVPNQSTGATTTVWIVIGMRSHQLVAFADAESGLRREVLANGAARLTTALRRVVRTAHVVLDPRYGSWSARHGVSAPTPPRPAFVLNPKVDLGSSASPTLGSLGQSSAP
jgi:hypothetical protein